MTSQPSNRQAPSRGHPPATRETYEKLDLWRRQAWQHHKDPKAPAPDHMLLLAGEPTQFASIRLDALGGETAVYFKVSTRKLDFEERILWPEAFSLVRCFTLFGGGLSVNDDGKGLSYLRLFGGGRKVQIARLLVAARPGEIALQLPATETGRDFREVVPDAFVRSAEDAYQPAMSGGRRMPRQGRPGAVRIARDFYHPNNHHRTDIGISASDYEAQLWDLFALHDAIHTRRTRHEGDGA